VGVDPAEITGKKFSTTRKGYDPSEVDAFLRELASSLASTPADGFGQIGDEVASVLQAANETASSIRAKAETDAAAMLAEAEQARADHDELRAAAKADAASILSDAESYARETRENADTYASAAKTETDSEREASLDEARAIRSQAEEDGQRRVKALLETAQEKVDQLAAVEAEIRVRVQSTAIDVQRLADQAKPGAGVIDIRDRRRAESETESDEIPASRAVWTAAGSAMTEGEVSSSEDTPADDASSTSIS